jgi:hypothetical protein
MLIQVASGIEVRELLPQEGKIGFLMQLSQVHRLYSAEWVVKVTNEAS